MGMERIILLLQEIELVGEIASAVDVYVTAMGTNTQIQAVKIAENLRESLPSLRVMSHCGGGNFKKQMKRADKSGARFALIIGETELEDNRVTVKDLRGITEQQLVAKNELAAFLEERI